uniref:LAGLIDADG endonuclease n=1 Tax=Powellomyces hirtus TaxID=109895 RepID=A0A4V1F1W6_9FUNG|nr:LAGLIDADG endonuclease [Powellomyces hirtus]
MGLSGGDISYAIGCMLGTVAEFDSAASYLLIKNFDLAPQGAGHVELQLQIAQSGSLNLLFNSKNGNWLTQSAGNFIKRSSETIRRLSNTNSYDSKFNGWLAGVMDGDGNFDLRKVNDKLVLKAIRIKLHNRDVRILTRIQDKLSMGRIRPVNKTSHVLFIISTKAEMIRFINCINGQMRIKVGSFTKACDSLGINMIPANPIVGALDPYFSGLIDTDGSIVFNYPGNRIGCILELKYNEYSAKLNLDNVIPGTKPGVRVLSKASGKKGVKRFSSIRFSFDTVQSMPFVYEYFMVNRLYCDMKFYRVSKIIGFLDIRRYQTLNYDSPEFKIYSAFLLDWIQYLNPLWARLPFVKNLRK